MTHATRTARTTSKASELMLAPFRSESSLPIPRGSCALPPAPLSPPASVTPWGRAEVSRAPRDGRPRRRRAQLPPGERGEGRVAVRGRRAPTLGWAPETLGHVEADGALARLRTRRGVDRGDGRGVEHRPHQPGEIAEVPGREVAILPQDVQWLVLRHAGHAWAPPRSRSKASRKTPAGQPAPSWRVHGL